jgi:hypothetical protein
VARVGEKRNAYKALMGKSEGGNHLEDLGVDGSITLKWILRNALGGHGLDLSGLG